jgi:hypothetical protein
VLSWLVLMAPRLVRGDDSFSYKYKDYTEAGGRMAVKTDGALVSQDLVPDIHFQAEGVIDGIAGATPNGQPAPAQCFNACSQLVQGKGLREIIAGPRLQTLDPVLHLAPRGENEHPGGTAGAAKPGQHGKTVELGQVQIKDDQIRRIFQRGFQTVGAVMPGAHEMPVPSQRAADVPGQLELVLDHQETHGGNILAINAAASNAAD